MENKIIKFPLAAILFLIFAIFEFLGLCLFVIIEIVENQTSNESEIIVSAVVSSALLIAPRIFTGIVLLQKKLNKLLFIATIPFIAVSGYYLIIDFSVGQVIQVFAYLLLTFIVGTATLPQLSACQKIAKRIYFLPAILYFSSALINVIIMFARFPSPDRITDLFDAILFAVALFLFASWCMDPYTTIPVQNAADDPNAAAPSEYDEAYCSLEKHIVLCLFTFGIWPYIWIYRTTKYLNKTPGAEQYDPTNKLLLCMFVPFYSIYWLYKHGQRIDAFSKAKGLYQSDMATLCLILGIFIPIVAIILMQNKINALCMAKPAPVQNAAPTSNPNDGSAL